MSPRVDRAKKLMLEALEHLVDGGLVWSLKLASKNDAKHLRERCYRIRRSERDSSRKDFPPDHELYNTSQFDDMQICQTGRELRFVLLREPINEAKRGVAL